MKFTTLSWLTLTTAAAALASVHFSPCSGLADGADSRDATSNCNPSNCNPRPPLTIAMTSLEPDQDPLSSDVIGLVAVHVGATSDLTDSTVKVSCATSRGLSLYQGPATFVDDGAGVDLMLEKHEANPQWLLLRASVERSDGETFHTYEFFGYAPQPQIAGAVEQDGVTYLTGEQL